MRRSAKVLAYLGSGLGVYGWFIGICVACLATGRTALLAEVFWPGFLISGILALLLVVVLESVLARFGPRSPMLQVGLWGALLSAMGLLFFLMDVWLAGLAARNPALESDLAAMGAARGLDGIAVAGTWLMAAGVVLLAALVAALVRSGDGP